MYDSEERITSEEALQHEFCLETPLPILSDLILFTTPVLRFADVFTADDLNIQDDLESKSQ